MNSTNFLTREIKVPHFILSLISQIKSILKDKALIATLIACFVKNIIFLMLVSSDTATRINPKTIFFSTPPILTYISFILIFLSFSYLFKKRAHLISLATLNLILTIIIIGDVWYYRANRSFLTMHMLSYTSNLDNLGSSIIAMFRWIDLIYFVDLIILIVYFFKIKGLYKTFKRSIYSFLILVIIPIVYLTYAHIKIDKLKHSFYNQTIFVSSWAQNQTMSNLTPIGYHVFETYKYFKDSKPYIPSEKEKADIDHFMKTKAEPLPPNEYKGMFKGKNLIVLQVESLENFVINQKVNGQEITPTLNYLAKNGLYFDNFIEQTHNGTTSDAELLTNTSIFPVRDGSTFYRYPSNTYKSSLPDLLEGIGYHTLAVHPDRGSYWNWMPALTSIGFDKCIDSSSLEMREMIGLGLSDRAFLPQLVDILDKEKKPFYSFSITLTNHTPFNTPSQYVTIKVPENLKGNIIGNYIESVKFTDDVIAEFIEDLNAHDLLKDSVIVLYGDHEGPHKYFNDEINKIQDLPDWIKNNNGKIPFIIYSEGMKGQTINTLGGEVDILPTLAYLMGVNEKDYMYSTMGRNLLNTKLNYTIAPKGKVISENLTNEQKNLLSNTVPYSDKIIRSNLFRKDK